MTSRVVDADAAGIAEAARLIQGGNLVAFPTETVYGLGADATNDTAVARIFAAKGRPSFNPLIVHVADVATARRLVRWTDVAERLAVQFWPGALTFVLERDTNCPLSLLVSAGLQSVAVRVPAHPIATQLLSLADCPIAAPSANVSGAMSPTTASHVAGSLGTQVPLILDGGPCRVGLESTVIDLTGDMPILLRPGGIALERIEAALGRSIPSTHDDEDHPKSPGMLARHYAPRATLRLDAVSAEPGETLLGFGPSAPADTVNLSTTGNLDEAAANLFVLLHRLDESASRIAVMPIPETGLGRAINDRLRRAAKRD
ncbi:MAG: threonylcarbamoyl-AMP synthase [Rhodospirillales bacterium]|nr:threonylcarbamoyl-AMP synthase [Rhodospirillales bacterium]